MQPIMFDGPEMPKNSSITIDINEIIYEEKKNNLNKLKQETIQSKS